MSCTAPGDCVSGQVCGATGYCVGPDVSCPSQADGGGGPPRDAGQVDGESVVPADASPDAPTSATLHVHLDGQGKVTVVGVGTCEKAEPQNGDCSFFVWTNVPLVASASSYPDWSFEKWTSANCAMESTSTCTFAAHGSTTNLTLKFRKDD